MSEQIKVAVVGTGMMGRNHVRVYSELESASLVGVADVLQTNLAPIVRRFHCSAYTDYRQLFDEQQPDAVSIAVPTIDHLEVVREAVDRGIHVLVEKPIAHELEQATEMVALCKRRGVVLAIGHVERFNPAVIALKERIQQGELGRVFQIDARRQSPFPARVRDVGVIIDLAVHDLDVMRFITGKEARRVYAETEHCIHASQEDMLTALLRFEGGVVGTLTVNWLTPAKVRELQVMGERGMFKVDYLTQDLYFYENAVTQGPNWDPLSVMRGVSEGRMIRHAVAKAEPLRTELSQFLSAVTGKPALIVSGEDGIQALKLAHALIHSGMEQQLVHL